LVVTAKQTYALSYPTLSFFLLVAAIHFVLE